MKIKTLLFLGIFAIAILPANAELTTSDVRSRDYLMNHGHSSATADIVQMQNDSVNGVKSDLPIHHRFDNKSLGYKWVNKFFIYLDPAQDDGKFLRHDTKFTPQVDDL